MAGSDIKAGGAFVELFVKDEKFKKGFAAAGRTLTSFAKSAAAIAGPLAAAFGFSKTIKAASDLEETMNKFNVVFGENAKQVKAWGDNFAKEVGRSEEQIARFMSNSQDLFVPLGFDPGAAEAMSKQITGLSLDLASFNNMQDADTIRDLHAALTGSGEVMKKYGVVLSEAAVKQELLNQRIDPKKASDQEKVQARLNLIMRGTTAAQGDAVRSSGSFANQLKALKASVTDAAAAIGGALLPGVTSLISMGVSTVQSVSSMATSIINEYSGMAGVVVQAAQNIWSQVTSAFWSVMETVVPIAESIGEFVIDAFKAIYGFIVPILAAYVAVVQDGFSAIWDVTKIVWTGIVTVVTTVWDYIGDYVNTAVGFVQDVITGALSVISFAFNNWRLLLETAVNSALLSVVRFSNQVVHIFSEVIPTWLGWFYDNWRNIFTDIANMTATVAGNIWENLRNLWDAITGLFNGEGFSFTWTPLTEGFESAIKELPKIAEREMGPVESALQDEMDRLGGELTKQWKDHAKEFAKRVSAFMPSMEAFSALIGMNPSPAAAGEGGGSSSGGLNFSGARPQANRDSIKSEIFGSFSAAALMASGGFANSQGKRIEQAIKDAEKQRHKDHKEAQAKEGRFGP